jgi:phosphopantothenoylcysteine synthetase/decarboxylase
MASPIRCIITAGPTREHFDPVRFISNPSTGKMGFALAGAGAEVGWQVHLIAGPVSLPTPPGVLLRTDVESAEDMLAAVREHFENCDILIMTAAVSDMRPVQRAPQKVKKEHLSLNVVFERTPDILLAAGQWRKAHQCLVGFAAETESVEAHALAKMQRKGCDYIVANRVGLAGAGFASDRNEVILLGKGGLRKEIGPDTKAAVAKDLVSILSERLSNGSSPA